MRKLWNTLRLLPALLMLCSFSVSDSRPKNEGPHANCCLCMCHAKDETKCSRMCVRLQHGKKIVDEPTMDACTKECSRVQMKRVDNVQPPATENENNFCNPDYVPAPDEFLTPSVRCVPIPCDFVSSPQRCIVTI